MNAPDYMVVGKNQVVSLRYIMRNRYDEVLEDRTGGEPAVYLQGGPGILPSLQRQLEGLPPGGKKLVSLFTGPESDKPDFVFDVEILSVRRATSAEIALGYPLPVAADCGPDCDCYDEAPQPAGQ